jgi:hypothetical protein
MVSILVLAKNEKKNSFEFYYIRSNARKKCWFFLVFQKIFEKKYQRLKKEENSLLCENE